jgi:transcriptional regulator with XRE-family HTH domain
MTITGPQVRAARLLLGWTQDKLAVETRVSPSSISHFETGRRRVAVLSVSTLQRALEEAGVEFFEGEPGAKLRVKP